MGDIKVLAGATVAVLLVGFFIAGAMLVTTRGGGGIQCGQLDIGVASGVRSNLEDGPYFQTGGGHCGFWLALENDDIVAYKAVQPSGCTVVLKLDHWECDSNTIAVADLAEYPVSIQTLHGTDHVIVNLGTVPTTLRGVSVQCGRLNIGLASYIRKNLAAGPYLMTGAGRCAFWLALDNNRIVAYQAVQPSGCRLHWRPNRWACNSRTVSVSGLAQYPISIQKADGADAVIADLDPVPTTVSNAG